MGIMQRLDALEQEVVVLEALRTSAANALESYLSTSAGKIDGGVPKQAGDLWVRIDDSWTPDPSQVERHRFRIDFAFGGLSASSACRHGDQHVVWAESVLLRGVPSDVFKPGAGAKLRLELIREDGRDLGTHLEELGDLSNQRVLRRSCTVRSSGWRVDISVQWVSSRAQLLRQHLDVFEDRLRNAREEVLACQKQLLETVPKNVWE